MGEGEGAIQWYDALVAEDVGNEGRMSCQGLGGRVNGAVERGCRGR